LSESGARHARREIVHPLQEFRVGACDPQRAVCEDTPGVGEMADDRDGVPLARRVPLARLRGRGRREVRRPLLSVPREQRGDVAVRHEGDVAAAIRMVLVHRRARGA
jgi:hypothetical protein